MCFSAEGCEKHIFVIPSNALGFSLDYLGTITASLRKDMPAACADNSRLDMAVKTLLYDELDPEEQTGDINTIDISHVRIVSSFDYLIYTLKNAATCNACCKFVCVCVFFDFEFILFPFSSPV